MIENSVINQIQLLIQQGQMSQRKIAKFLGVSRGTVQAVAHGKRTQNNNLPPNYWVVPSGQPQRCPLCGSCVRMPCLACQLYENDRKKLHENQEFGVI